MNYIKFYAIIAVLAGLCYLAYTHGYDKADAEWQIKSAKAQQKLEETIRSTQEELYATEKAWLDTKAEKELVYREKTNTVTKVVTKYVKTNQLDKCRIGNDGMLAVNKAITG